MSYDIQLCDPVSKVCLQAAAVHHVVGGTYCTGGTRELWLNVTYSYARHFYRVVDAAKGIRVIYGKTGAESIPILEAAIKQLGTDVTADYWQATEGNARRALHGLLAFAQLRPDGIWQGD